MLRVEKGQGLRRFQDADFFRKIKFKILEFNDFKAECIHRIIGILAWMLFFRISAACLRVSGVSFVGFFHIIIK